MRRWTICLSAFRHRGWSWFPWRSPCRSAQVHRLKICLPMPRNTVGERIELTRRLDVKTSQARMSARMVALMPIAMICVAHTVLAGFSERYRHLHRHVFAGGGCGSKHLRLAHHPPHYGGEDLMQKCCGVEALLPALLLWQLQQRLSGASWIGHGLRAYAAASQHGLHAWCSSRRAQCRRPS